MPKAGEGDRRIAEWLFLLTFAVYGYFYAGAGWNQNAQLDLTRAIVERHTFAIDAYAANTGDVAKHGGHTYANKSPGISFLGAIPYALVHPFVADEAIAAWLVTLLTVVPFGALIPALLFLEGRRRGFTPFWSAAVALTVAFATLLFPYSTMFMLHVPSGALMLVALTSRRAWLAGLAAGGAVVMNYLCAPILLCVLILRGWRSLIGAVPPLLVLAIYQRICFGAFTTISIAKEDPRFLTQGHVMGVFGAPSLEALLGITISPYRGLFYFAPVLLLAVVGMLMWRAGVSPASRGTSRAAVSPPTPPDETSDGWRAGRPRACIIFISAVFFAFNVCFNGWEGGFGVGARYLVPLIPLWGIALLHAKPRWLVAALAAVSFVINFAATAVDPLPSGTIPRPLTQYILPLLIHGRFSERVPITPPWSAETFTGHTSVNRMAHDEAIVFSKHAPGSLTAEWSSFNLGEPFFGAGDARSLIPVLLLLAGGAFAILRRARQGPPA